MKLYENFVLMVEKSVGKDIKSISNMSIHSLLKINNKKSLLNRIFLL